MRLALLASTFVLVPLMGRAQSHAGHPSAGSGSAPEQPTVADLDPKQLSAMLGTPKLFIYDCNEEDMFVEAHVPGAKLTIYDAVTAETLPTDLSATVVFYCYSPECPASTTAAHTAIKLGHTSVYTMLAGITGWQDAGLPTEP